MVSLCPWVSTCTVHFLQSCNTVFNEFEIVIFDLFFLRREFCQGRKLCAYTMLIVRHTMQTLMEMKWMLTSLKHNLEGQRHILLVCKMNNGFNIHWFIGGQPVYIFFFMFFTGLPKQIKKQILNAIQWKLFQCNRIW